MNNANNDMQRLQQLLILHRYDIYADRRKNRIVYTVSALQRLQDKIQQLQRATSNDGNDGNEQPIPATTATVAAGNNESEM